METQQLTNACEHELNLVEENWISYNEIEVILECSLCKIKLRNC